jgi:hypothetical protein
MKQIIQHLGAVMNCNRKQGHFSDRRICKMMTSNDIRYNPATSTFLSVVCLAFKSSHMQNMLLRIESTGIYIHHKQLKGGMLLHTKWNVDDCRVTIITFVKYFSRQSAIGVSIK